MTAPSLDQLRDIHLPADALGTAFTPAIWMALAAVALAALTGLLLWARHHRRTRPLRRALTELAELERARATSGDDAAFAGGLSRLLRRYARWRFPSEQVSGLTGATWLAFLDAHGGRGDFMNGPGAVLATLPYAPPNSTQSRLVFNPEALVGLVRRWLQENAP